MEAKKKPTGRKYRKGLGSIFRRSVANVVRATMNAAAKLNWPTE